MKKIIQGGDYFAHQNETRSQEKNLKWFASSTHFTIGINFINPAPATLEQ